MTRNIFVSVFFAVVFNTTFGQTKAECLKYIKLIERTKKDDSQISNDWVSSELKGNLLVTKIRLPIQTVDESTNMKQIETITISYNRECKLWYLIFYFSDNGYRYKITNDDGSPAYENFRNERAYYGFESKNEAIKTRSVFIRLATILGAKPTSLD